MFKLQHPNDLITRLFMLEYMRELGADLLYSKASPEQKKNMFYKFEDPEGNISVDLNWESLIFNATLLHLEGLLKHFMKEIEEVDNNRKDEFRKMAAAKQMQEDIERPVDINLMDFAASRIKENQDRNKLSK